MRRFVARLLILTTLLMQVGVGFACDMMGETVSAQCCCVDVGCVGGEARCDENLAAADGQPCCHQVFAPIGENDQSANVSIQLFKSSLELPPAVSTDTHIPAHDFSAVSRHAEYRPAWLSASNTYLLTARLRI